MKIKSFFIYLLISITTVSTFATEKFVIGGIEGLDPDSETKRYPILLALSGGGARGLSIIGILKAFEEKNLEVVGIAGTSMGGIIGGLYASGYTPTEIEDLANNLNFSKLFSNSPPRNSMFLTKKTGNENHLLSIRFNKFRPVFPKALTSGQELTSFLTRMTTKPNYKCKSDFSKLPIPYLTISTDIVTGEQVILQKGSLSEAMRSTMAFPLAFTGIEVGDRILMDGGMVTPIPVELARTLSNNSQFVVAINTTSKLAKKDEILNPVDIANQVTSIMTADKLQDQLAKADFVMEPPIDAYLSSHFDKKDTLLQIGYEYGIDKADEIIAQLHLKQTSSSCLISDIQSYTLQTQELQLLRDSILHKEISHDKIVILLKEFVNTHNYFSLDVEIDSIRSDSSSKTVQTMTINGLKNFSLDDTKFEFIGNTIFSNDELEKLFQNHNYFVTRSIIKRGLEEIIKLYEMNDYDLAFIEGVIIDAQKSTITIKINEAKIQSIDIEDNIFTKDWFVRSYFPLKKGELYSTKAASEGIRNIYGTDIFDRVTVDAVHTDNGVRVRISVKEKYTKRLRFGWHWDDEYETEEFIELLNDNFAGIGLEYKLHGQYAPRRENYYFSLKADRIFKSYLTSQIKIFRTEISRQMYTLDNSKLGFQEETNNGFQITVGQQIERLGAVTATFSVEEVEIHDTEAHTTNSFGLRKLKFNSLFENFDKIPFPNNGNKHIFSIEFAGKYVGGDAEFTKFYTSHETYLPIGNYFTYHPRLALGASRSGLPLSEKFYLGGLDSFIGFGTDQLSGDKMFIFTNEFRVNLPFNFYISARYDLGEVYNSFDQIKVRNLRNSGGVSISMDSPIGPFTFGYGYVNKNQEEIYTQVGFNF